jgi:hypothetical protein
MRASSYLLVAGLCALLVPGCASDPSLYVHRLKLGRKSPRESGETLKSQRPDGEHFGTAQPGFFALKSRDEWTHFWEGSGQAPEPPQIDYERKMVLVAVTESAQSQALRIGDVIETGIGVHVYVTETRPGEACPTRTQGVSKQDFVIVDHSTKPVHFHVEPEQANSCGDAPIAHVQCRVAPPAPPGNAANKATATATSAPTINESGSGSQEIFATPGETVECDARQEVRGVFAAVDRRWSFYEFPQGSSAKLLFDPSGMRVRFSVDNYGRYGVRFEVMDDGGRKGDATTAVVASPSKDGLYMRLGWSGFNASDDPETFPRVRLETTGPGSAAACSADATTRPPWCDIKRQGRNEQLRIASQDGSFPTTVKYIDDRASGSPMVCLKVFLNGVQTTDVCDKEARKSGDTWRVGALVSRSGLFQAAGTETPLTVAPTKPGPSGKPAPTGGLGTSTTGVPQTPKATVTQAAPPKPQAVSIAKPPAVPAAEVKKPAKGAGMFNP